MCIRDSIIHKHSNNQQSDFTKNLNKFKKCSCHLPYIRLFTRHVLSTNVSLKSCIKSMPVIFFHKIQMRALIYLICKNVSNLRNCIYHNTLTNLAENGWTRKKPDIWYFIRIENNLRYTQILPKILQQQIKYKWHYFLWIRKMWKEIIGLSFDSAYNF